MDFKEDFLQAVWKYQYFDKNSLHTTDGQPVEVKKIGYHNFYHGPDFLESSVRIKGVDLYGHVEVHRKASDWKNHEHDADPRYNSVILHVVYENDLEILRNDGTRIPTLELKGKILLDVIRNYEKLINSGDGLLCSGFLPEVLPILKFSMLERALVERMEIKSAGVFQILETTKGDWEETSYRWLFQSFGFKTNSGSMLRLAESIPYKLLQKLSRHPIGIEAILLGQADLLPEEPVDEYSAELKREYDFYRKKYGLKNTVYRQDWKFMGVRPQNNPCLRIVQLAAFLSQNKNIFSEAIHINSGFDSFKQLFALQINPYWEKHLRPGIPSKQKLSQKLSENTLRLIMINFVVPLWFSYGRFIENSDWKDKCFDLLQELPAEVNHITKRFGTYQWTCENAFDSQGMIGLFNMYCNLKKCMDCKIGQSILKAVSA
ncbi:MAG: DUF2851 family protein [Mongoliibacter sp.]|uniref:DUF2851 family protein n=1 Tax=Mongoliibacter sp. TaxID=2022438 RepID=UPI0012F1A11E|nr:DUF2851 family protein [Mongoliibacter sp.]TVP53287.1 MAG: DUF2851 family protein [Mongoliibacter sp.]